MMNKRIRLTDDERLYLMSLIETDNNITGNTAKAALLGKPIKRLLTKLGDTKYHEGKARIIFYKNVECPFCSLVCKSGAGLSRHTSSAHTDRIATLNGVKKHATDNN